MDEGETVERREDHVHLPVDVPGGTAKARTEFQNQLEAVARETALARILDRNISALFCK